ncbi:TPM domain-containing protein [Pedobacter planticolens]|nr:TPM domain-containing protein [Pedobacter planticolens]
MFKVTFGILVLTILIYACYLECYTFDGFYQRNESTTVETENISSGKKVHKRKMEKLIFDMEEILSAPEIKHFDSLFRAHEKLTGNEIVLVTTSDYGGYPTMKAYARDFLNSNGIGKKGRNNGLGIFFSRTKRETRISTGTGTQKVLSDFFAKQIIDSLMIPAFKVGRNYEGILAGVNEIISFLERPENKILAIEDNRKF